MWIRVFTSRAEAEQTLTVGRPQLVILGDERIALIRLPDSIYAVQDFCTHNKESLSRGALNYRSEIICPWHGYCFDLKTGRESQQRSADLRTYPVRLDHDGLYIQIAD